MAMIQRQPQSLDRQPVGRARVDVYRPFVLATGVGLIVALGLDLVIGWWTAAPWLHVVLAVLSVGIWIPASRRVHYLTFGPLYVLGLYIYTILRSFADQTGIAPKAGYVIYIEEKLFFGHVPTVWLQERLFEPGGIGPLDWLTVQIHWSFFIVPHLAGAIVWMFRRELFPKFVFLVLGTFYVGLMLYFLFPTVPPWLAADYGNLPGVARVMDYVGGQIAADTYTRLYDALGVPNAVAAMPSLHMGVTFAVYLFARDVNRKLAWVMLAYSLLMAFSLVYLGEHYVTDTIVGAACAFFTYRIYWAIQNYRLRRAEDTVGER